MDHIIKNYRDTYSYNSSMPLIDLENSNQLKLSDVEEFVLGEYNIKNDNGMNLDVLEALKPSDKPNKETKINNDFELFDLNIPVEQQQKKSSIDVDPLSSIQIGPKSVNKKSKLELFKNPKFLIPGF